MGYGKKDVPLGEVKLQELPKWFSRRNMSPESIGRAMSRAYWRWNHKYCLPKYCGMTPFLQTAAGFSALFYLMNYSSISHHRKDTEEIEYEKVCKEVVDTLCDAPVAPVA